MSEEKETPLDKYKGLAQAMVKLCKEYGLDELDANFRVDWGETIRVYWQSGRHGETENRIAMHYNITERHQFPP